jgi:hypothetical protein
MYGGMLPFGFGTHGRPLQQFALVAHASPGFTHCAPAHLGTPTLSSLQTSPSGLQPIGLRHTPTVKGGVISHVTGWPEPPGRPAEPQQSLSFVQRSPTTWQPLAGWQMRTPVGPYGAQRRLQHAPPQAGIAPMKTAPSSQSMPSVRLQFAEPEGGDEHVP